MNTMNKITFYFENQKLFKNFHKLQTQLTR